MDALAGVPEKSSRETTLTSHDCGKPNEATRSFKTDPDVSLSGASKESSLIQDGLTLPRFFGKR